MEFKLINSSSIQCHLPFIYMTGLILLMYLPAPSQADTLNLTDHYQQPIGESISYFQEQTDELNYQQAQEIFNSKSVEPDINVLTSSSSVLTLGLAANPVWIKVNVNNDLQQNLLRQLTIETSWLDEIDIYYLQGTELTKHYQSGDRYLFQQREQQERFFTSGYHYPLGKTELLLRIATVDPMVIPLYFLTPNEYKKRTEYNAYSYGLLYGAISALLIYNFMLFISLQKSRYFFYILYLASFLAINIAYTGHGYRWLWPEMPSLQMYLNPLLMLVFNITGLLFAIHFLDLKKRLPVIYKSILCLCALITILLLMLIVANNHYLALSVAFAFMVPFFLFMVGLGIFSIVKNNHSSFYFLLGSTFTAIGSCITALAVLGVIPFTVLTYRAVELGMLIDVVLLALALGELLRLTEQKKLVAEEMARTDPLTNLGNRRSFYEKTQKIWPRMVLNKHDMSLIMLDIDHFKILNDNYGHSFGDSVLQHIANTINTCKRSRDITARWGGEEFIILLPETNSENALNIAQRICSEVQT